MAANDLTTLAAVKQWLNIASSSDDALLGLLITAASQYIETYCDRPFVSQSFTEVRNGRETKSMQFANYPCTAVSSLLLGSLTIPAAPAVGSPDYPGVGYVFTETLLTLRGYRFWHGTANVQIQYTAGYTTIPADLVQCANELVGFRYRQREHIGLTGTTDIAGQHIGYDNAAMTPSIALILEQYRKRVPT